MQETTRSFQKWVRKLYRVRLSFSLVKFERNNCFSNVRSSCSLCRLRGSVCRQVSAVVEASALPEGLRDVLCPLQLRPSGHLWQPGCLSVLCKHDHPRQQAQVPLRRSAGFVFFPVVGHRSLKLGQLLLIIMGICCCRTFTGLIKKWFANAIHNVFSNLSVLSIVNKVFPFIFISTALSTLSLVVID